MGAALLLWGVLVGRATPRVGTVLAIVPLAVWFGLSVWIGQPGVVEAPNADALLAYLLIGLLAFLVGSNLTSRRASSRGVHRER